MTRFLPKHGEFRNLNVTAELVEERDVGLVAVLAIGVDAPLPGEGGGYQRQVTQARVKLKPMLDQLLQAKEQG